MKTSKKFFFYLKPSDFAAFPASFRPPETARKPPTEAMDPLSLHNCFQATLEPDQNIRRQAEVQLKQAEKSIGFLGACLDIIGNGEVNIAVRTAAAVFFKNRIVRRWNESFHSEENADVIDQDEKPIIREKIISTIIVTNTHLRKQLVSALTVIITTDYPKKWPELLQIVTKLLYSQDLNSAFTGLLCLSEITRSYRWNQNEDRPELNSIINEYFPVLLKIANNLVNEENPDSGEIVKLILKIYKFATYYDLPLPLQSLDSIVNWSNFHVSIINKTLPKYIIEDIDESDRSLDPWVKCKKWSYANLFRLFQRYSSLSLSKKYSYNEFKKIFNDNVIPNLLNLYFNQIDQWCNQKLWLSKESLYYILQFIENGVTQKFSWPLIKPHFEILVSHFIFPLLCPTDEVLETFENDPQDYIHSHLDIYDENNSADLAATSLLITLISKKKKTTLEPILQFIFTLLNQFKDPANEDIEVAKKLEGALRLITSISDPLVKENSPYYSQMEDFLSNLVFQHFNSKFAFIKARTCEVCSKFSDIKINNEQNLGKLYHGILESLNSDNLPVQLEASLALQNFIKIPQFKEALSSVILPTMQKLLVLSNTIESDAISGVMQEIVESFSEQLQPFGVELMGNLTEQFLRLARELNDASNVDPDTVNEEGYDDLTDKQMAALGLLNTMVTVLLSFESSTETVYKLEETFAPVVEFVLVHNLEDFFREVGELIENSTFLIREISPTAWKLFQIMNKSIISGIAMLYLDDWMPSINNYLVYGSNAIKNDVNLQQEFFNLFKFIMENEDSSSSELSFGGEIAQKFIFILQENADPFIIHVLSIIITSLNINKEDTMTKAYNINMINTIVSCLIRSPQKTLEVLVQNNFLVVFFKNWFNLIPVYQRVFDLKLATLGLLTLINLPNEDLVKYQLNSSVNEISSKLANVLGHLPNAITEFEKRRTEYNYESGGAFDDEEEEEDDDGSEWVNEDADEEADAAATDDYLRYLSSEAEKLNSAGFYDDDDEDVVEDPLAHSILDELNVFAFFKESVMNIQSTDMAKYQLLFSALTPDEQDVFKQIMSI